MLWLWNKSNSSEVCDDLERPGRFGTTRRTGGKQDPGHLAIGIDSRGTQEGRRRELGSSNGELGPLGTRQIMGIDVAWRTGSNFIELFRVHCLFWIGTHICGAWNQI